MILLSYKYVRVILCYGSLFRISELYDRILNGICTSSTFYRLGIGFFV